MLKDLQENQNPQADKEELKKIEDFKASPGWLQRFMNRYDLVQRRITGTGRTLPKDCKDQVNSYLGTIQLVAKTYDPKHVFNYDETSHYMDRPGNYAIEKRGFYYD
jgi:hypothetical protein